MFGGGHVPLAVPDGSPPMLFGYSLQCSRISDLIKPCIQYAYTVAENNTKMSAALRSTLLMTSIGSSIKDVLTEGEGEGVRKLRGVCMQQSAT